MMLASSMNSPYNHANQDSSNERKRKNSFEESYLHSPSSMDEAAFLCKKAKMTYQSHLTISKEHDEHESNDLSCECYDSNPEENIFRETKHTPLQYKEGSLPVESSSSNLDYDSSEDPTGSNEPYDCEGYDKYDESTRRRRTLYLEYWTRTDECKERKWDHLDELDAKIEVSREDHIYGTTLKGRTSYMEPNMFPYDTPAGIEHWTLWSRIEMTHYEVQDYVEKWIDNNATHILSWNYDDNPERSINIFHVHVYLQVDEKDSVLRGRSVETLEH